ncbi:MAG: 23S rRNA (uracil(1939)-C(5))-methyltransferase RlmD [Flavobacteriales bacterium]|nr:23S rRNA (uracil(1939)-C(5))-methyltransferase RlmD [Flavobacteriales bacterium]
MCARKRKPLPFFEELEIIDAGAEGKAIAKPEGRVVFITNAVPGDIADVQIFRKKKRFFEGKAVKFHTLSDKRTEPICSHFGTCGGCKWQSMGYEHQLFYKQKQVSDNLSRIGHLVLPEILPILGSKETQYYRNKLEFTFTAKRWLTEDEIGQDSVFERNALGFHVPGRFDAVLAIDHCYLQGSLSNELRTFIKDFALENKIEFFDLREQTGYLRNLIIRTSSTGENMMILSVAKDEPETIKLILDAVKEKFTELTSIMYVVNGKRNDTISDLDIECFSGNDHIFEKMEGLTFKIGPKSFYQTNSDQAYELYKITRDFADIKDTDLVYDLYTGTGTIANFIAKKAKHVVGVEYIPEAIEDAKENSELNKITNTTFFAGDMKDVLNDEFISKNGKPDVVITDPPRAGMHEAVTRKILAIKAKRVVYVSCNPATQARDLEILSEKYAICKVQPVDMFPHTHHVENVVLLSLKK